MKLSSTVTILSLAIFSGSATAFVIPTTIGCKVSSVRSASSCGPLFSTPAEEAAAAESVFLPLEGDTDETVEFDIETVESLGRGAAKAKRGKRKSGSDAVTTKTKAAVTLTPEETFYEGPPAITETIVPTISILSVIGIIPAAAAWARQAWVRYKITTRRIRVTSGINGQDMAEIVYPDVVEIRTVKRLFGDGDMVLFLRDGAKFEMRNIPDFDNALEFVLKQCDPDVVKAYRKVGDVTQPQQ